MTSGPLPALPADFQAFPFSSKASRAGKSSPTAGPLGLASGLVFALASGLAAGSSARAILLVPLVKPTASSTGTSNKLQKRRLGCATIDPSQKQGLVGSKRASLEVETPKELRDSAQTVPFRELRQYLVARHRWKIRWYGKSGRIPNLGDACLLYTSDAAD